MSFSSSQRSTQLAHGAVTAILLACYGVTAPSTLTDFDGGEFALLAQHGGISHAPGYPAWVLLLRLANALRGGLPVVLAMAWMSIAVTVLAANVCLRAIRAMEIPPAAAAVGTLAVFLSQPVWRAANGAEPFALNLLLAAGVVRGCQRVLSDGKPTAGALVLGLALGLGAANHHTLALLLPMAAWAHFRRWRACVVPFALGLIPGALMLVGMLLPQPEGAWVYGDWSQPGQAWVTHLLRIRYGTFTLSSDGTGPWWQGPWSFLRGTVSWLSVGFLALYLVGVPSSSRTPLGRALLASTVLAGLLFPILMRRHDTPLEGMLVERFLALPLLLMAPAVAWGMARASSRLGPAVLVAAMVALVPHVLVQAPGADRSVETFLEAHARNVMGQVKQPALLVTGGDHDGWGALYAKGLLGLGAHVEVLPMGLSLSPWYTGPVASRLGMPASPLPTVEAMVRHALANSWHVYTLDTGAPWFQAFLSTSFPVGPWVEVVATPQQVPAPLELLALNARLLEDTWLLPSGERHLTPVERMILAHYARPWSALETSLREMGALPQAQAAHAVAVRFLEP